MKTAGTEILTIFQASGLRHLLELHVPQLVDEFVGHRRATTWEGVEAVEALILNGQCGAMSAYQGFARKIREHLAHCAFLLLGSLIDCGKDIIRYVQIDAHARDDGT